MLPLVPYPLPIPIKQNKAINKTKTGPEPTTDHRLLVNYCRYYFLYNHLHPLYSNSQKITEEYAPGPHLVPVRP